MRTADQILREAEELLHSAECGLDDLKQGLGRGTAGFRTAVVFGRMATFALQNLRGCAAGFDEWYAQKQEEMKADPEMVFFNKTRRGIEHEAKSGIGILGTANFTTDHRGMPVGFGEPPPGATGFFIGDHRGGSGWKVRNSDGTETIVYIPTDPERAKVFVMLSDAPGAGPEGVPAETAVSSYLSKVGAIVREAKQKFGTSATSP